jgi:hypothetical protein
MEKKGSGRRMKGMMKTEKTKHYISCRLETSTSKRLLGSHITILMPQFWDCR